MVKYICHGVFCWVDAALFLDSYLGWSWVAGKKYLEGGGESKHLIFIGEWIEQTVKWPERSKEREKRTSCFNFENYFCRQKPAARLHSRNYEVKYQKNILIKPLCGVILFFFLPNFKPLGVRFYSHFKSMTLWDFSKGGQNLVKL